jgi:hypothetical protein
MSKRQCFWINPAHKVEGGYIPALVTENEPGYQLMSGATPDTAPWVWGPDLATAEATAERENQRRWKLDKLDALKIVASSMGASRMKDNPPIRAEVHSDDHEHTASFNALPWFEQASDDEIRELAGINWGGNYEADAVAEFCTDTDDDVAAVFEHKGRQGFECHVCESDAARWLQKHKPALYAELWPDGDEPSSEPTNAPYYQELHGANA